MGGTALGIAAWVLLASTPAVDSDAPLAQKEEAAGFTPDLKDPVPTVPVPEPEPMPASPSSSEKAAPKEDATGGSGRTNTLDRPPEEKKGLDAIGVPLVSYNSDLGWGFGLVGGGYYYSPGYLPYRHAIAGQGFITTRGVQNHWLRYDGPQLLGKARLEVRGEYRRELRAPFYGPGNQSSPEFVPGRSDEEPYSFDYFFPGGWARIRGKPAGPLKKLELFAGYGYHWVRVIPYEASMLERAAPRGLEGGSHGQVFTGATWDTRDNESDPTRGGVEEIALRFSGSPTVSDYTYAGVTLSERRYFQLGSPKLIFAQRVVFDFLMGDVPFFEWAAFGGVSGGEGIGGMSSVRGVPRNRYQGKVKAVSNSELRFYPFAFQLLGEPVKVGGVAFFDMGRVWHENVTDGPWHAWHPGVGGGLRLARRAAVVRFDVGVATETRRPGLYVTFGHMF